MASLSISSQDEEERTLVEEGVPVTPLPLFTKRRIASSVAGMSRYYTYLLQKMQDMLTAQNFTDITLKLADGTEVHCHKLILVSGCPFFHTLFLSGMKESHNNEVNLPSLDPLCVRAIVNYFYTGSINIEWSQMQHVVTAAHFLQLEQLKLDCDEHIAANMPDEEHELWYEVGKMYELPAVVHKCEVRLFRMDESVQIGILAQMSLEELMKVLKRDDLDVSSEDEVLRGTLNWINQDTENRANNFEDLIKYIRLDFCSKDFRKESIENNTKKISEILQYHIPSYELMPRQIYTESEFLLVCSGRLKQAMPGFCFERNVFNRQWKLLSLGHGTNSEKSFQNSCLVPLHNGFLLVTPYGGAERNFHVYDTENKEKWHLPCLPSRSAFAVTAMGKRIYCFSKPHDLARTPNKVLTLNLDMKDLAQWETCGATLCQMNRMLFAPVGKYLYLLGCLIFMQNPMSSFRLVMMRLDTATDKWKSLKAPGMLGLEHQLSLGFVHKYGDKLFFFSDSAEENFGGLSYHIESATWEKLPSCDIPHENEGTCSKIIFIPNREEIIAVWIEGSKVVKKAFDLESCTWLETNFPMLENFEAKKRIEYLEATFEVNDNTMKKVNMAVPTITKQERLIYLLEKIMLGETIDPDECCQPH